MKLPVLEQLLAYENKRVVHYFSYHHPHFSPEQSQQIFYDLLGWMWLNIYRQTKNKSTYLFGPLLVLDEAWHTFILHTEDYISFCEHYFGAYFHHHIEPLGYEHELSADELADFLSDAFEYLGQAWIERHFADMLQQT